MRNHWTGLSNLVLL
ncbi:hypothetical protein CFP56_028027 [Quercus suber]|uniref:Uncharacterized protein n=1 Tax=Quercus suber TaxID=58331 RepID=A0AAW0JUS3_QUESU